MGKRIKFVNFDEKFDESKIIDESEGYKKNEFDPRGIYSEEIFGEYYDDVNDITKKGWIKLNHKLISPVIYLMLKKKGIIKKDKTILRELIDELEKDTPKYLESIRNKKNTELVDYLFTIQDKILIDKFPVFSHKLRPVTIIGGQKPTIVRDKINNNFSMLVEYNNQIKELIDFNYFGLDTFVQTMQDQLSAIVENIMQKCSGKKGILRKEVLGAKINNSSRCVIVPYTGDINIDDCALPYLCFLELYKYQIINLITRIKGYNYNQALQKFEFAKLKVDEEIYSIMCNMIKRTKGGLKILLNRNPTISIGSILLLNIKEVKHDIEDYTLSISNNILSPLAGDYDGDVLNIIALHDNYLKDAFRVLSPRNLIINKNGVFDVRFSFIKEQNLGLYLINNK